MQCFIKKQDKILIDLENGESILISITALSSAHCHPFCYSFVSSISFLLLKHSVQLSSPSSLAYSLFYAAGVIRLNIATTSAGSG